MAARRGRPHGEGRPGEDGRSGHGAAREACHTATRSTAGRSAMALPIGAVRLRRRAKLSLCRAPTGAGLRRGQDSPRGRAATTAEVLHCVRVRRVEKNGEEEDDKLGPLALRERDSSSNFIRFKMI